MFKRRITLTFWQRVRDFVWPKMGWLRTFKYMGKRIIRLADSSHKIATGLAFGAAISFTPVVGTHVIQAGILTYITRGNLIAAAVGTFAGNPWTFPFMWWVSISVGAWIFGLFGVPANVTLPDEVNFTILWEIITNEPLRIFLPWAVGGYICAAIAWLPSYLIFLNMVRGAKIARRKARERRLHKIAKNMTGQDT